MTTFALGFNQYNALDPLFEFGSPVAFEPLEDFPGQIVDMKVTYFTSEVDRETRILTADGDLVTEAEWTSA